jgi:phosphoglycolate phosphatase-like HAD superfamily hydrolase
MTFPVIHYSAIAFDCDGVVLNSNELKSRAFYETALPYGQSAAEALVDYHKAHGGISRYRKFEYFLHKIVASGADGSSLEELVESFAGRVRELLEECEVAEGLQALRDATPGVRWLLVSGGDQQELRDVFTAKGIDHFFDGGIFGSPNTKDEILAREINHRNIIDPAVFVGDSRYDYEASERAGLDFIFVKQWTEFKGYEQFFTSKGVLMVETMNDLVDGVSQ